MDLTELLKAASAAGVGGFVFQQLSRSPERRQARAAVRQALSELERARWTRTLTDDEADAFGAKRRAFVTAAMVARVPRELTEAYARAAVVSAAITKERLEESGE